MASSKSSKKGTKKRPPNTAPTLLIAKDISNPCCPEGLKPVSVRLTVLTHDLETILDGPLGYDPGSDTYMLEQAIVDTVFARYGVSVLDIETFEIDGQVVDTFMCGPNGKRVPWSAVIAKMREYVEPPLLRPDVIAAYPQKDVTWEMTVGYAGRYENGKVGYMVLLVDQHGRLLQEKLADSLPNTNALLQLLLQGCVYPLSGEAATGEHYVPTAIATADDTLVTPLKTVLKKLDAKIELRHAETPHADAMLELTYESMGIPKPFLRDVSPKVLRDYFGAARRYYRQEHWSRVRGDKYIGVQIDGGDWHYLNLMGQEGEAPGVMFFTDWLAVCEMVHSRPHFFSTVYVPQIGDASEQVGDREAIALWELDILHPDDEVHVRALKKYRQYSVGAEFPLPLRLNENGVGAPEVGLEPYTLILNAVDTVLSRRSTPVITSIKQTIKLEDDRGEHQVVLRYPAKGDEAFRDETLGTYRVTVDLANLASVEFSEKSFFSTKLGNEAGDAFAAKIVLEASGDSTAWAVAETIRNRFEFYVTNIVTVPAPEEDDDDDDSYDLMGRSDRDARSGRIWSYRDRYAPQPFVRQLAELARLEPLAMSVFLTMFPVTFERISDSPRPKDDAVRVLEPRPDTPSDVA